MQNSMVVFTFSVLDQKNPFWGKSGQKYQVCQFKLKFGTKTNLNMQNLTMMVTFSVFVPKYPFWTNLVHKFKIACSSKIWYKDYSNMQNSMVVSILSALDWKQIPFWANVVQKTTTIVSLSWKLVLRLIRLWRIQWWYSFFSVFDQRYTFF